MWAAATGVVGAIAVAVIAIRHADATALSPIIPRDGWNQAWIAAAIVAFACYGVGFLLARPGMNLRAAIAVAVVAQALPLVTPLLLSRDVYHYWSQGRIVAVHHANPYVSTPADYSHDPATPHVAEVWRDKPAPYGPVWEVAGAAAAPVSSARAATYVFRVIAVLALLASVALVAIRRRSARAVAILGWNPLLALHFAGGGHSDAVMMLLVLGAVAAGTSAKAGALWPIASAIKPFAPVLVPLELAQHRLRMGRRWWIALVAAAVGVVVVSTALFGFHWIRSVTTGARETSPVGGVHWLAEAGLRHRYAVVLAGLVFVAIYLGLLRRAWRTGRARFSLAASALCLTSSLLRPWYTLWPVALAALEDDVLAALVAYALTGYLLFGDAVQL